MVSAATAERVTETVIAVRSADSETAMRAMGHLAAEPPEDVVEELGARIVDAALTRGDRPVTESAFLPDPEVAMRLVAALKDDDVDAVHAVVGDDYSRLLTTMVGTLAALES